MANSKSEKGLNKIVQAETVKKIGTEIVADSIETSINMKRSYVEWRKELAWQCGVFVFGEQYLAKRFYQINYQFCSQDMAKEIVTDNLFAILRNKYFKKITDEIDDKIRDIVKNFTMNLASTLKRVSFDKDDDCDILERIPDYCVAFRNGVYDFKHDTWLFKYDIEKLPDLANRIYSYDMHYVVQWYLNFDFAPIGINIMEIPVESFVDMMIDVEEPYRWTGLDSPDYKEKNICFELMYNMSHNSSNEFDMEKFKHLCEVIGYVMNVSFIQAFVMLIGSGRNGKNSLFDGCFSHKVVPMPAQISMFDIENNNFVSGALQGRFHNIFLETDEKSVSLSSSANLKQLTGSELQMAEKKGKDRVSTYINCKFVYSANEQEKLKFGDISDGFARRINMFEVFYQFIYDVEKLKRRSKSYYYTPFKQDLSEVKNNLNNIVIFVYLAMYGIKNATKNFTRGFEFSKTDWNNSYSDIDLDLKDKVNNITLTRITNYMKSSTAIWKNNVPKMFFDTGKNSADGKPVQLFKSPTLAEFGHNNSIESMYELLKNPENSTEYFAEYDIYLSMLDLQALTGDAVSSTQNYTSNFKKLFPDCKTTKIGTKTYVLVNFDGDRLKIRRK